jgi:hypothetical protein
MAGPPSFALISPEIIKYIGDKRSRAHSDTTMSKARLIKK